MGNINCAVLLCHADASYLSTPYGKHKRERTVEFVDGKALSTPYGKHKQLTDPNSGLSFELFLLPMGNINDIIASRLKLTGSLSTPYEKHKHW